jgi:hypothetical protein
MGSLRILSRGGDELRVLRVKKRRRRGEGIVAKNDGADVCEQRSVTTTTGGKSLR